MAKRRGAGEGSVYWLAERGLWVGAVDLGVIDGRRRRKVVKAKHKADVLARMRQVRADASGGVPAAGRAMTTGEWLALWVNGVLPLSSLRPSSIANYKMTTDAYLIPILGKVALARLEPEHVEAMMRTLSERGLSPATVGHARVVLRRALGVAEKRGRVTRNVAAMTDAPRRAESKLDDALDAEGAAAVMAAAVGDRLEALAVLALAVGMRQGECLALRWHDVDLDAGTVTVVASKTEAGRRTIALPGYVVASLRAHRARQLAERLAAVFWSDEGLVFATPVGTQIRRNDVLTWWHGLTIRAGVGRRRFHASRHTAATLMLNNGVPLEVVSKTLGHAGLAITADVYAKVRPALQRSAADAMQGLLGEK